MASAFQPGAFQAHAFQELFSSSAAFQSGAFQSNAFQTTAATTGIGGGGKGKSKRKWTVRKDGRLLVFTDQKAALTVLAASKEPQEEAPQIVIETVPKPKEVKQAAKKAESSVEIAQIRELALRQGAIEAANRMIAAAEYAALMALYQQMQDEEDVEILLMAL